MNPPGSPAKSYRAPFAVMTTLFFMWGFLTVWNDVLIPKFKSAFTLNYFHAMLVQLAFFGAYTVGSLIYYVISITAGDPINRIGYKNGVIIGLLIAAAGSALFFPAAMMVSYGFFLLSLFIVGLGFAMLQIAANPYVTILGPESTASSRLNLSQAFNSFGTTLGPYVAGKVLYGVVHESTAHPADAVKVPYLCFAGAFVLLAVLFAFAHLPGFSNPEKIEGGLGALRHPHTVLGMLAIFMYVGGEVSVGSSIVNYLGLPKLGGLAPEAATVYLSFYWGGLMIGRTMGAFALSEIRGSIKHLCVIAVPVVAFLFIILNRGAGDALHYGLPLAILLVAFFLGEASAHRMLALFACVILGLLLIGITSGGILAMWSILAVGLFCSVMWSNIFALAIEGLGPLKSQASSLLIMAILGGAVLPPLQGKVADVWGIQISYLVPMFAFAYIAFYGLVGYKVGRPNRQIGVAGAAGAA